VLRLRAEAAEALADSAGAGATHVGRRRELVAASSRGEGRPRQLAAELHDTVAQSLALSLSGAGLLAGRGDPELVRWRTTSRTPRSSCGAVLSRTRHRPCATATSATRSRRCGTTSGPGTPSRSRCAGLAPVPLPLASAVTLYRFFQEALLNVVKHAGSTSAELALEVRAEEVVATVRDQGCGFEPAAVRPDGGRHVGSACSASAPACRTAGSRSRAATSWSARWCGCACRGRR
jgi:hypothetical protein